MKNEDLIKIGFKGIPHFTIGNSLIYDLGRKRRLCASNLGTPNEMLFISEMKNEHTITDLICLHNWDFDGWLSISKVKAIIRAIELKARAKHRTTAKSRKQAA